MSIDEFVKSLVVQLPNFAGLLVCVFVEYRIIMILWDNNQRLQNRIDELCGDTTIEEIDTST
jgi:hypothetical protein